MQKFSEWKKFQNNLLSVTTMFFHQDCSAEATSPHARRTTRYRSVPAPWPGLPAAASQGLGQAAGVSSAFGQHSATVGRIGRIFLVSAASRARSTLESPQGGSPREGQERLRCQGPFRRLFAVILRARVR